MDLKWITDNFTNMVQIVGLIVVTGELITRLTPTKKDDGFMRRIANQTDRVFTMLRVPNYRKQIEQSSRIDTPDDGGPKDDGPTS